MNKIIALSLSVETKMWIQLKKVYQFERCKIRKILNAHHLTKSHFDVLLKLYMSRLPLKQQELADSLFLAKSNISMVSSELEKRMLVEKKDKTLFLSKEGNTEVESLLVKFQDEFKKQFDVLSPLELEFLDKLLNKLSSSLNIGGNHV